MKNIFFKCGVLIGFILNIFWNRINEMISRLKLIMLQSYESMLTLKPFKHTISCGISEYRKFI